MIRRVMALLFAVYALYVTGRSLWRGRRAVAHSRWPVAPEPQDWPFASVIIPAWRDRMTLETCLRTVAKLDYPAYELIVVAGGNDGTYDAALAASAASPRMRVLEQQPRGKNAALNQGLREARGDVLVLLDADSEVEPGWLKAMVRPLGSDALVVTGNYLPLRETPVALLGDVAKVAEYEVRGRVILQGSGGIAITREALDAIGAFPEERVSSDWDLDARVDLQGIRKAFAPDAIIRSHRPASVRDWWWNEIRWRRLHILSLLRLRNRLLNDPKAAARHIFPYLVAWGLAASVAASALVRVVGRGRVRQVLPWASLAFAGVALLRELASAIEVFAYRPQRRLLPAFFVAPALIVGGWAACLVATVSPRRAKLQFKGARLK